MHLNIFIVVNSFKFYTKITLMKIISGRIFNKHIIHVFYTSIIDIRKVRLFLSKTLYLPYFYLMSEIVYAIKLLISYKILSTIDITYCLSKIIVSTL